MARSTPNRQTPGVYITELDAFPPSIVGVQTALPAFIGYTQKAEINGKPVYDQAIKINSLVDFITIFGEGYTPLYEIEEASTAIIDAGKFDLSVTGYSVAGPYDDTNKPTDPTPKYYVLNQVGSSRFALYDSMRLFFANGGGTCYVVSVAPYTEADGTTLRTITASRLVAGLNAIGEVMGPTMLVVPDATLLTSESDFGEVTQAMLEQAEKLQDRVAILDVWGADKIGVDDGQGNVPTLDGVIGDFRKNALKGMTNRQLSYGAAYFPFLRTTVWDVEEVGYTNIDTASQPKLQEILYYQNATLNWDFDKDEATARFDAVQAYIEEIANTANLDDNEINALNQNLTASLPVMGDIDSVIIEKNEVSPPSGAMAGVYATNDQNKGVWNAPANVSLRSVDGLTYLLDNDSQADLNVPVDGKAIDAIRDFPTRGQVVWGARTLDGNSPDYRYVQVRRTLIYIEQSVKAALDPFVFAANDGKTWVTVTSMVNGFLQQLWNQGGLLGASASDAFNVECGLGSTMTGQDILDGYMIVNITLQMIRPAEFIELVFKQKMEGVA